MTSSQTNDADCEHEWVNARCAKCAVVSSERRLREFLEQSSVDYASNHGGPGPNGGHDVDLVRAMVSTLLQVTDYLQEEDRRRNPVERVIDWIDWPLRLAGILDLIEKVLGSLGMSITIKRVSPRVRQRTKFYG